MSSSDKDLNIPDLGPAERDQDIAPPPVVEKPAMQATSAPVAPAAAAPVQAVATPRRGLGIFTGGLLLLVLAACGGLGYWVMELQLQFQTRTVELTEARYQLGELQELLKSAENSALKSGESLITQVGQINQAAQARYKAYDAELARLKTTVEQKNQQTLANQQQVLKTQTAQLKTQDSQITDLLALAAAQKTLLDEQAVALEAQKGRLQRAENQLKSMAAQADNVEKAVKFVTALKISQDKLSAQQSNQQTTTQAALAQLKRDLNSARAELSTQAGILNEQLAEQGDALAALQSGGRTPAADPALQRRIAINEDAIQAFDGTRRQLNRELLQIRQKLNNLQLKVESR